MEATLVLLGHVLPLAVQEEVRGRVLDVHADCDFPQTPNFGQAWGGVGLLAVT